MAAACFLLWLLDWRRKQPEKLSMMIRRRGFSLCKTCSRQNLTPNFFGGMSRALGLGVYGA